MNDNEDNEGYDSPGHNSGVVDFRTKKVTCHCGATFDIDTSHPEEGHWESPQLDAHRAEHRRS